MDLEDGAAPLLHAPERFTPTDEQTAIQRARARHVLIEANAGAAKTTTLALRMAQALLRGAEPGMLLALTYTEPAVRALQQQLRFVGVPAEVVRRIPVHTFESFSAERLESVEGSGTLKLASREQIKPYVIRAVERAQTWPDEPWPDEMVRASASEALVDGLLRSFATLDGRMAVETLAAGEALSPALAEDLGADYFTLRVRSAYLAIRRGGHPDHPEFRFEGDATFDLARALLDAEGTEPPDLALGLGLIVVDEMHDTNRAMFTVLKALLAANPRAAFVGVGDRDQVIHAQAGAEAAFIGETFEREIGKPLRLPLTASHRFGAGLAQAAGRLAGKPYAAFGEKATTISLLRAESHRVMAGLIARTAYDHAAQAEAQELRILLRHPAHSILIERELRKHGVAFEVVGMPPFLQRREILLVRGLQAFAGGDFSGFSHAESRVRTLQALMLFAGALVDSPELRHLDAVSAQRRAIEEAATSPDGMRDFIAGHVLRSASALARPRLAAALAVLASPDPAVFARDFMAALDPLRLAGAVLVRQDDVREMHDNIGQLLQLALAEGEELKVFFELLDSMERAQSRMRGAPRVVISTIAAAKGLEFDHVLIPHLSRGEFVGEGAVQDSRNLLYVAMTRARQRLTLAFNEQAPSRFLRDAGLI